MYCMCMCSVCVCVYVYIYVCIYIYIYIHIRIRIHNTADNTRHPYRIYVPHLTETTKFPTFFLEGVKTFDDDADTAFCQVEIFFCSQIYRR